MCFLIRITGPKETNEAQPSSPGSVALKEMKMEELIHQIFVEENVTHDTWQISRNGKYFVVEFPVISRAFAEKILDRLSYYNVGKTEDSSIMVIDPAALVCKRSKVKGAHDIPVKHFQKFVNSLKSRLTVAQVYHAISNQGNFNFNYLCFLICAAIVSDIALVTDSAACVFASMLLSPLMEPIMCIIFGLSLRERRMTMKGFRNTSVSLVICIIVGKFVFNERTSHRSSQVRGLDFLSGIAFGIPAHFISMFQGISPYPTSEMSSRGEAKALIASIIVASASGVSVSFAILSNSLAAMIGNAISLSLLPPSVNCGQFFLLAVIALLDRPYVMKKTETLRENSTISVTVVQCQYRWIKDYSFIYITNACDAPTEFAIRGVVSFCLTLLNIILIIITGYSVNRLKDLVPQSFTNDETRRFYTKDLKEVRDNYDCVHRLKAADLAAQAYQEYLRLSLHPPEGDYTAEDTEQLTANFQAVMEGIGHDPHIQTIGSWTHSGHSDFLAEFTRATEALSQGSDNLSGPGNGTSGRAFARNSISSNPTAGRSEALGSYLPRRLRQIGTTENGDHEEALEQPRPQSLTPPASTDPEGAASPQPHPPPPPMRFTYQQNQRQVRTGFWQNLLNRRFSSPHPPPPMPVPEVESEMERGTSQWPPRRTPEDAIAGEVSMREPSASVFGLKPVLSRVSSIESDASELLGEAPPSNSGGNAATSHRHLQQKQHQQISRSAYDVSSMLPRNRSLASVSTIGGKFEVTPTIRKPQSTRNLGSYLEKGF
ncbi:hypothetical protein EGR_01228 [Echinococcus granulosus]|uniref:Uncharacterized protein n=1 Tax=Echinococcus granulosus TaxID=6210 RepID=W6UQW7_ECHGR|nr:hypothetical protein EGR_01228 [Echinococcus granulosus]EUB64100.1 hypothetical protein EGR_01228 [Echinococcus granulosus]